MALLKHPGGWTPASLLPSVAAGMSPGAAWSGLAPVQVSGNPTGQQAALAQARNQVKARVLGMPRKDKGVNQPSKRSYGL